MIKEILSLISAPVTSLIEGRTRRKELEAKIDEKKIEIVAQADNLEALWEIENVKANASTWKDEYVTVVISIPAILSFVCPDIVQRGFVALEQSPDWYQYTFITVMLAAVGINVATKVKNRLTKFRN